MAPCKFFLQGRCAKGDGCSFEHRRANDTASRDLGTARNAQPPQPPPVTTHPHNDTNLTLRGANATTCRFFQQGSCAKGASCAFSHDAAPPVPPAEPAGPAFAAAAADGTVDSRTTVPCRFFLRGECVQGDACPYKHANEAGRKTDGRDEEEGKDETEKDDFSRSLYGTITSFADGATVAKVQLPWELAGVRLEGLPANASSATVVALLKDASHTPATSSVRLWKSENGATKNAHINLASRRSAEDLCQILQDIGNSALRVSVVPPILPSATASKRLSCKKLALSWHVPTKLVWLNFGLEDYARRASAGFNDGIYTILDQAVEASEPKRSAPALRRGRGGWIQNHGNRVPWTVVLKNVPMAVREHQIEHALPIHMRPRHVEMSNVQNFTDPEMIQAMVESFLANIGPLEFEIVPSSSNKRSKARALFEREDDAREAAEALKERTPAALKDAGLIAQLVVSARFKISKNVHDKLKNEMDLLRTTAARTHVKFKEFPDATANRFVTLKVEGEKMTDVKAIADQAEKAIAGTVIMDRNSAFWSPSLALPASQQHLRRIEDDFDVVFFRDTLKRQLRVVGSSNRLDEISTAVIARFGDDAVESQAISLSNDQFIWACRGGFTQIVTSLGRGVASLDITCTPKKIVVTGSLQNYQCALDLMQDKDQSAQPEVDTDDTDCAICYTEAENAVIPRCGHRYCLDCFENMCKSAAAAVKETGVCCQGDMGSCGSLFCLQTLRDALSSAALEEVLEVSFNAHIQHRPSEYRYCPTPDCGNVYRPTDTAKTHTCTGCMTAVCTACHNQHATMTCADYKDLKSGGYAAFEKLKKELNIKDCPKCSTPIEKTDGCNHMTCGGCRAHICWVCMKTFVSGSGPIYDHMNRAHGSIGLEY